MLDTERLTTRNQLADWLALHLDGHKPRVQIHPYLAAAKHDLLRDLRFKKVIYSRSAYVGEMMRGIYWTDAPLDAEWCSISLLQWMSELTQASYKYDLYEVPLVRAVDLLMSYYDRGDLRYRKRGKKWLIMSTRTFRRKFGVKVRVSVGQRDDSIGEIWELGDLA